MKKMFSFNMVLVLMLLCGCNSVTENKQTQFLFDTVVTLTADCNDEVMGGAFALCRDFENMLSRTVESSEVYRLNSTDGFVQVSQETVEIIERGIYYSKLSNGSFDITIQPVSALWDFEGAALPDRNEIAAALKNVDYGGIEIDGKLINLNGRKIDLGSIAKGYIADRLCEYFKQNDVPKGIIDLGGNIVVFGDNTYNVGIKKPFSDNEICATVRVKNKSVVTSGVYERYIEHDGKIYHHILDTETGYACDTDLLSATVITDSSLDGDALATVCMLGGLKRATEIVESTPDTQAVFIDTNYNIHYTSGLIFEDNIFTLK